MGRDAEVDCHEDDTAQHGRAEDAASRCRHQGNGDVDDYLASVVRADEMAEQALAGECVFLEVGEVPVALILLEPSGGEENEGQDNAPCQQDGEFARRPRRQDGGLEACQPRKRGQR